LLYGDDSSHLTRRLAPTRLIHPSIVKEQENQREQMSGDSAGDIRDAFDRGRTVRAYSRSPERR